MENVKLRRAALILGFTSTPSTLPPHMDTACHRCSSQEHFSHDVYRQDLATFLERLVRYGNIRAISY
jgi:hypothetical protein